MRSKLKLILTAAVVSALAAAGLSVAAGGDGGGGSDNRSATDQPPPPGAVAVGERGGGGERGHRLRGDFGDADVRAVMEDIHDAVAKQAPAIAGPVIDKAESDGKITEAQADKLRQAAQDIADGERPDIRGLGRDEDVHEVIHDAFEAAREKAPGIAEPIIDKAVEDDKITEVQADRLRAMVRRGGPGPGPGGRGFGRPGPPAAFRDADVRAVLEDIREAVAKEAPDVVNPVIDKAEDDGKITAAQADRLRDAVGNLVGGKPRGGPPRMLDLRDEDVRAVVHDAFEALGDKTAEIAKPIIDKAVADDKITERQANQIRNMQRRFKAFHGPGPGGPGFDRPAAPPPAQGSPS
jgi:hypothetical protein